MDPRLIALLVVCAISIFCGALVALSPTTALRQKVPFVITIGSLITWQILLYLSNVYVASYESALLINRIVYVGPVFAVLAFSEVIVNLVSPENLSRWPSYTLRGKQTIMRYVAVATAGLALTPFVVKSVSERSDQAGNFAGYNVQPGMLYLVFGIVVTTIGLITVARFVAAARYSENRQRRSLLLVLGGLIATITITTVSNYVLPIVVGSSQTLNVIGTISPLFILLTLTYTMLRHKLLDVRSVVLRTTLYSLVVLVLSILYIAPALYILGIGIMGFPFVWSKFIYGVFFATFIAMYFQHLRSWFEKFTARIFFRDSYDSASLLGELNRILVSSTDTSAMLTSSAELISHNIKPEFCLFVLFDKTQNSWRIVGYGKKKITPADLRRLDEKTMFDAVAVPNALSSDQSTLKALMKQLDSGAVARLSSGPARGSEGIGYMILGYKKSGRLYDAQDVKLLEAAADVLSIAIQNALHFEEIQNFNLTLQETVDQKTLQLRRSNAKLVALDETKDDFISMASHQLRTPLTSVKGYLSMVLEGDAGKVNPMQRKMLAQAFMSSQHMVYLIADLLNVSRLKNGKFVIEPSAVNLAGMIQEEISQLRETAKGRGLTLVYEKPKDFPSLMLDETKTRQVVMNFIDNAIHYTQSGGTVRVELHDKPQTVELRVVDTGIGVPKNEQPHLFTKFYRAGNARRERPDGTGLGLFMAKKVVVAQGGAILFDSKEGKGSTFGFSLSKTKLAVPQPAASAESPTPVKH